MGILVCIILVAGAVGSGYRCVLLTSAERWVVDHGNTLNTEGEHSALGFELVRSSIANPPSMNNVEAFVRMGMVV